MDLIKTEAIPRGGQVLPHELRHRWPLLVASSFQAPIPLRH